MQTTLFLLQTSNFQQKMLVNIAVKYNVADCKVYTFQVGMFIAQFVILHMHYWLACKINSIHLPCKS